MDKNKYDYDYSNMYYPYMPYDKKKGMYYNYPSTPIQMPREDYDGMEEMDLDYMKKMYPDLAKQIQYYIDEECDKMEYDGSYMYDEYPDREAIQMIVEKVYEKIMEDPSIRVEEVSKDDEDVESQQFGIGYGLGGGRFIRDFINVMLLNEIFGRRRRYYRRRRRRPSYRRPYYSGYDYYYY